MFKPSAKLVELLVDSIKDITLEQSWRQISEANYQKAAIDKILDTVYGLLGSMARSLQEVNILEYCISSNNKFTESILKAVRFRVLLSPDRVTEFMALLYNEILSAASNSKLSGPFWKVCVKEDNSLVLVVEKKIQKSDKFPKRVRATVVHFGI
jgi:hypothetical protein